MPPSKPQKYTPPPTNNSYWEQFLPPQPVVQPKPVVTPAPKPVVVQGPAPTPANPWLPIYVPPPPKPTYNPLPVAPQAPVYNPLPQNPVPQNPVSVPQQWRPELIQPMSRPDIGATPIGQTGTFSPTAQSGLNNFNQSPMQGPQPQPWLPQLDAQQAAQMHLNKYKVDYESGLQNPATLDEFKKTFVQPGQAFSQRMGEAGDALTGNFTDSAAYRQMEYYNQQLDERRPYGTAGVWDMWQQVQEGAGQIGQAVTKAFQDTGSTPQDRFQAAKEFGAGLLGGALNIADAPRDTAVGYAATAPIVGAVNASQAAQRYVATREVGKNTVGEYISSYGGAALDSIYEAINRTGNLNPLNPGEFIADTANKTLQQFQQAGTLTVDEQRKLAAIDPTLPTQVRQDLELNYATVESQQSTRDQLVQKYTSPAKYEEQATKFMQLAATTKDKGEKDSYLEQAALAGYKAMKAQNTNPYEIVDSNTSWQQMLLEAVAPDPLFDGVGMVFKGLGMLGDPMKKVFGSVTERRMLKSADQYINNVGDIAVDIEKLNLSPNIKAAFPKYSKVFTWTSGTVKAQQDAYNLSKAVIGLLSDVDNVHDARILLNIMSDSKQLAKAIKQGIPYQLLHSPVLRDLAGEDFMVRIGFGAFADKGVQNSLKTWAATARDFLQNADSLKKAKFDKVHFASEFIDTMNEAGYARYGVAKTVGKGAQTNYANMLSSMMQRTMSTFQIKLNPGSWVRDVAATAGLAMGDGVFAGAGDWRKTINAMYPDLIPSALVEGERLTGAATTEGRALGKGLLNIPKPSAFIEENMANNIFAKSVLTMNKKYIPKALNSSLAPLLKGAGVDQRTTNAIINSLTHTMMTQGKAKMVSEFNNIVSGITKPFDLKQYAGQIDNLLSVDELNEIYKTVQTAKSPEQFQAALDTILDNAQKRYAQTVIDSPIAPQRYDWTNIELSQDAGDYAQGAEMAVRQGGLDPTVAQQATAEAVAAAEKEKGLLDTLVQFVTDSQDPNARYAIYNVWAQRQDLLMNTRVRLSEMAEDVIARGGGQLWANEYFPAAREMWTETRGRIEQIINDGKRLLNEGQDLSQNYGAWGQLERVARSDEAMAMTSLMLEPQSAKYDGGMLREVMAAKRAIEDRAAARAYAAGRRVIGEKMDATTDVMDVLLSADRDINIAGAKVRAYLNQQFARLMGENGKVSAKGWDQYFSLRNAKWREHTEYAVIRWRNAETQAVLQGKGTGLVWADPFTAAPKGKQVGQYNETLELIGQSSKPGHWWVRKPDDTHMLMPDGTVKTVKPKVPQEIISQYKTGYAKTELVTEDELDNIMSGAEFAKKQGVDLMDGKTASEMEQALIEQSERVAAAGVTVAPHSGHMATQGVEQVQNLRQQLLNAYADYAKMTPNKVSEAMQLQLYQAFRTQAVPAIDNVLTAAASYGDKMRSFVVPDRLNKTRVDELLALVMPYHFWFTRTAKNAVERMIYEPGTFRRLQQLQADLPQLASSAQGIEKDPNMPTRYQGAMPIQIGDKTYYMYLDLGQFMPNMVSMLANKFASPDTSEGGLQYALESMQSLGFGLYPYLSDAVGVASGVKKPQDIRPLGYFPLGRTLAWEASNYFGVENMPALLRAGNEEYLIGRQVSNMAQRGDISVEEAGFALDYLRQLYAGDKPLPEQARIVPDERMQTIIDQATQAATLENRNKYISSMSGVTAAPYDATESQILGAQDQYFGSQYPANPYGGKTASQAVLDANPGLTSRWGQKAITDETKTRPGIGAAKQAMYADQKDLKDSMTQSGSDAVDAAIAANPSISKKEMYAARINGMLTYAANAVGSDALKLWLQSNPNPSTGDVSKFVVDILIGKNYPSVYNQNPAYTPNQFADAGMNASERTLFMQSGGKLPAAGMNLVEQTDYNQKQAVDYATYNYPGKPEYVKGDKTYGDKLAAWEAERTDWLSTQLGVTNEEAKGLLDEKEASGKTESQINREEEIDAEFARREAEWQNRQSAVLNEFGEEAGAVWAGYYALDKAQRKAYMEQYPEMKAYNMAAWNPNEYAEAKALFGESAWMEWAKVPAYADTDEAKAARNAYWMEYPTAKVLNAWVNGRPANYDESKADDAIRYNFGKDYAEAIALYGDNIWELFKQYNPSWSKAQKSAFYRANGMYGDFTDWWYGNEKKETSGGGRRSGGGGGGGGGGYSYNRTSAVNQDRNVQIYSQGLSQGLANTGAPQQWRPTWIRFDDGRQLKPERMKPWQAINVKRIAG